MSLFSNCKWCGIQFSHIRASKKYCSAKCNHLAYYNNNKRVVPESNCEHCKRVFQPKSIGTRFCSKKCNSDSYYQRQPLQDKSIIRDMINDFKRKDFQLDLEDLARLAYVWGIFFPKWNVYGNAKFYEMAIRKLYDLYLE